MNVVLPLKQATTVKEAVEITGGLSRPSKMPGKGWGIPAEFCKRGSKLREAEGTVCSHCYARKGRHVFNNVQKAYHRRYSAFTHRTREQWIQAMTFLINKQTKKEAPFFRVFDSGDLQDEAMLEAWIAIAKNLPHVSFWMATREHKVLREVTKSAGLPDNLVVRASADMVAGPAPKGFAHVSKVSTLKGNSKWKAVVETSDNENWYCPAPLQGNNCGDCRACWDKQVKAVIYRIH